MLGITVSDANIKQMKKWYNKTSFRWARTGLFQIAHLTEGLTL
jgi:hypothetical protein